MKNGPNYQYLNRKHPKYLVQKEEEKKSKLFPLFLWAFSVLLEAGTRKPRFDSWGYGISVETLLCGWRENGRKVWDMVIKFLSCDVICVEVEGFMLVFGSACGRALKLEIFSGSANRDMDDSVMDGRQLAGPSGGFLDLELPIHGNQQLLLDHSHGPVLSHQCRIGLGGSLENDHQCAGFVEGKGSLPRGSSRKAVGLLCSTDMADMSEDDEPCFKEDGNGEIPLEAKGKKGSPWHRMKWTSSMIRLLIAVVARVSDDGSLNGVGSLKRKSRMLQKKGKWKTVSKIMIGMGCHVSPQQCEDKFNDLNKRYKKLNDILGRGTSCKVVENPGLMDLMPKLSEKEKDVVRKILCSKHLFYQEMCAYHNGQIIPNCPDIDLRGFSFPLDRSLKEDDVSEDEEADRSDASEDDNDDEESNESYDGDGAGKYDQRKKLKESDACPFPQASQVSTFEAELAKIFQNPNMSLSEKTDWIKKQKMQLSNHMMSIKANSFEIEKQRFKWLRYRSKKDVEFEQLRLENERMRLENEQSMLLLRRKQLEMDFRSAETSNVPTLLGKTRARFGECLHFGGDSQLP